MRKSVEIGMAFDHASMCDVLTDTKSTALEENLVIVLLGGYNIEVIVG